jgi:hypothetical protein
VVGCKAVLLGVLGPGDEFGHLGLDIVMLHVLVSSGVSPA